VTWRARNPLRDDGPGSATIRPAMGRYLDDEVVAWYRAHTRLFPGERAFVADLQQHRAHRLLDLGVGAGRTTEYFAGLADEYVGTDSVGADVDRQGAFSEVRRVCARGGRLFFSSKNLNQFREDRRLWLQLRRAVAADDGGALPVRAARGAGRFARAHALNPSARRMLARGGGLVTDDSEVEVYGMEGERIAADDLPRARGWWLHYLCRSA